MRRSRLETKHCIICTLGTLHTPSQVNYKAYDIRILIEVVRPITVEDNFRKETFHRPSTWLTLLQIRPENHGIVVFFFCWFEGLTCDHFRCWLNLLILFL